MTWWQAIVLGLVEGITEYLPVSSTGHLILVSWLLGLDDPSRKSAMDAFGIVIQGGAILAVLGLYWPRVVQMLRGLVGQDPAGRKLLGQLLLAFLPAAAAGPVLDDAIEAHLFHAGPVLFALAAGGLWMIWLDRRHGHGDAGAPVEEISWAQAFGIGCFQAVAMWPGTSRSMMTIGGGTLLGLRPIAAAEFSFLLGLPTLGSACAYKLLKNLLAAHKTGGPNLFEQLGMGPVVLGIAVATVSAAIAVRWLVGFLNRRGLSPFGWYRIALAAVVGLLALAGVVQIG
jgi:undecaprenyl-diphosphatase